MIETWMGTKSMFIFFRLRIYEKSMNVYFSSALSNTQRVSNTNLLLQLFKRIFLKISLWESPILASPDLPERDVLTNKPRVFFFKTCIFTTTTRHDRANHLIKIETPRFLQGKTLLTKFTISGAGNSFTMKAHNQHQQYTRENLSET